MRHAIRIGRTFVRHAAWVGGLVAALCVLVLPPHAPPVSRAAPGVGEVPARLVLVRIAPNPVAVLVDERAGHAFVVACGPLRVESAYPEPAGPGAVSVVDTRTGQLLRTIRVGVWPMETVLNRTAHRLYVLNEGALTPASGLGPSSVSALDTSTGTLVRTVQVGIGAAALAVDERRGRVFVLSLDPGTGEDYDLDIRTDSRTTPLRPAPTSVLDATTGRLLRRLPGVSGIAVAVGARAGRLLVASALGCQPSPDDPNNPSCLGVFDEATGKRLVTRSLPLSIDVHGMVSDDATGHAFAVLLDDRTANGDDPRAYDHVLTLDARTGTTLRDAVLPDQEMQTGALVASAPAGRVALVAVPGGYALQMGGGAADVSVIDARGGRALRTVWLGAAATSRGGSRTSAVLDARRGRIVVLAQALADPGGTPDGPAVFNVLDARTGRLLHTARGQAGDVALGLDARHGRLFVANARSNTVRMLDVTRL